MRWPMAFYGGLAAENGPFYSRLAHSALVCRAFALPFGALSHRNVWNTPLPPCFWNNMIPKSLVGRGRQKI